jgi:uncharacterized metal-binding protein
MPAAKSLESGCRAITKRPGVVRLGGWRTLDPRFADGRQPELNTSVPKCSGASNVGMSARQILRFLDMRESPERSDAAIDADVCMCMYRAYTRADVLEVFRGC